MNRIPALRIETLLGKTSVKPIDLAVKFQTGPEPIRLLQLNSVGILEETALSRAASLDLVRQILQGISSP